MKLTLFHIPDISYLTLVQNIHHTTSTFFHSNMLEKLWWNATNCPKVIFHLIISTNFEADNIITNKFSDITELLAQFVLASGSSALQCEFEIIDKNSRIVCWDCVHYEYRANVKSPIRPTKCIQNRVYKMNT